MEHLSACPLCGSYSLRFFLETLDFTLSRNPYKIVQCTECGFKFTNPRPDAAEISRFYTSEEYISHSGTRKGIINFLYHYVRNITLDHKVNLVKKTAGSEDIQILDYGCGTGDFLNRCRHKGWKVTGIEPEKKAVEYARKKFDLDVRGCENLNSLQEGCFDVVTLWHVLEHLHRLDETAIHLIRILKPGGFIVLALPNCNSRDARYYGTYWAAWDVPRHLYHFTPADVNRFAGKYRLHLTDTLPMYFDSFYVSMLSEKYLQGNILSGVLQGLLSNVSAFFRPGTYSSQIYIMRK
ncbi:MAG: class I SAM-dependent methyltransferase [Bacteroidetes bacterium]|nr:class I SAM-dependent methyltransferase [Bacteroidota bacterium]